MKEITITELQKELQANEVVLIDVRESYERDIAKIEQAIHIPMGDILERASEIPADKKVVVHCRSGQRSAAVIDALQKEHNLDNLYNLQGGILAWSDEIDSSITKY
jgi:adenylyltransferase/sulfurtransferase